MGASQSGTMDFLPPSSGIMLESKESNINTEVLLRTLKQHSPNRPDSITPTADQFELMFTQSKADIDMFFNLVESRISDLYINLSKQTLELMCDKKLSNTESKIFISEEILYTSINILKVIGQRTGYKYDPQIIYRLNSLQFSMLGYMKAKYPRQSQNFVPGELMQEFRNFDFVEQPENDILRELKVYFGDNNQNRLILQVKKFINMLIRELNDQFPIFEQLLSQKVFVVTKEGKPYTVNNRIGRKIPENVDELNEEDQFSIDLKSPEIFRVIVKWVNDMEDYILHPQEEIKEKDHFKTVKITDEGIQYDYITPDEIQDRLEALQSHLMVEKQEYEESLKSLKSYIELFNHNLIKIITKAQRRQRYVPKREAQIIKYSMFNKRLLSWTVIEKLMIVLKKLIKTSHTLEAKFGIKLDLVKFNVTDLMRAMITGNKFEILKVFNNLKALEEANIIKILKIKNRLETPLNDAMVIFKMKSSFIICELQLILSDGHQSVTDKLKNIETLNHFFYEIERSPYGVMAELASLLSFKDNKTNFESKITFENIAEFSIEGCRRAHSDKVESHSSQKKPFICSHCTQFYGEYENQYNFEYCAECNKYQCIKCLIAEKKYTEQKLCQEAVRQKLQAVADRLTKEQQNFIRTYQPTLYKDATFANDKQNLFELNCILNSSTVKTPLRNIGKKKNAIALNQLEKFVGKKEMKDQTKQYFCICKFEGLELYFTLMKNDALNGVTYCFDQGLDKKKQIEFRYFDFLMQLKMEPVVVRQVNLMSNINIFRNFSVPRLDPASSKQVVALQVKVTQTQQHIIDICKVVLIVDVYLKEKNSTSQNYGGHKNEFRHESIEVLRKTIPNLIQTNEVINLGNEGVTDEHLNYFQRIEFKSRVKFVNLHNNNIKDIKILLTSLPNLQTLIVSKNYIDAVKFQMKLGSFRKLVAFSNRITALDGVDYIPNVSTLNLNTNYITSFNQKKIPLLWLRILDLRYNQLRKIESMPGKDFPKLSSLVLTGESFSEHTKDAFTLELPRLQTLRIWDYNTESFSIANTPTLQFLTLENILASQFTMNEVKALKQLTLSKCTYANEMNEGQQSFLEKMLGKQYDSLLTLSISQAWSIAKLPTLVMPVIKSISIDGMNIVEIFNLTTSKLPLLQNLKLVDTHIVELPMINLPKLRELEIGSSGIGDVSRLSQWIAPCLNKLTLNLLLPDTKIPSFKNIPLTELSLTGGMLSDGIVLENSTLTSLELYQTDCFQTPPIILPELRDFCLTSCRDLDINSLQTLQTPKLSKLYGNNLILKDNCNSFPVINFPCLSSLEFICCRFQDLANLGLCSLPSLQHMHFSTNTIEKTPALNFSNLEYLQLSFCGITDLSGLTQSNLPKLTKLLCQNNNVPVFPLLSMPKLEEINMSSCRITNIDNLGLSFLPALKKINLLEENTIESLSISNNLPLLEEINLASKNLKNIEGLASCKFSRIKVLNLNYAQLDAPKALPKLFLPNLVTISLERSNIEDISNLRYSDLPQLTELVLNYSKIWELPVMKFRKLTCIKYNSDPSKPEAALAPLQEEPGEVADPIEQQMQGSNKKPAKQPKRTRLFSIKNLQSSELPELTVLEFQNNEIEELPTMRFAKLRKLFLTGNNITNFTQFRKSKLPVFELLNVYNNKIMQLPIGKQVRPTSIYMNGAAVEDFSQLIEYAPRLENFFYNQGQMPKTWPPLAFKNVKIFQLNMCQIVEVGQIFKNPFDNVIELSISDNQIVRVPKLVCPKLQKLHLNRNCIQDVKQFSKSELPCSKMISLESNQVADLVDWPFVSTGEVFLSHNKFTDVSFMSKYAYVGLKMLVIWDAKLIRMCRLNAPVMQKMYVNENDIESLEQMRGSNLPKLYLLQMSKNKIRDISPLMDMKLTGIKNIYITHNRITKLCKVNLPSLNGINLSQNPIENVDQFLKEPPKLSELSISLVEKEPERSQNYEKLSACYPYALYYSAYANPTG